MIAFCFHCSPSAFRGPLQLPAWLPTLWFGSRLHYCFLHHLDFSWSWLPHTKMCYASLGKKLAAWGLSAWRWWGFIKWDMNFLRVNLCTLFPCANLCTRQETACHHEHLDGRFSNCPGSFGSISVHWTVQADLWLVTRCICQLQHFFHACELISHCHLCNWADCYQFRFAIQNFFVL